MKIISALLLQLVSFSALAGNTSASLLVTVTVIRPAPVTTVTPVESRLVAAPGPLQPQTTTTTTSGTVQHVLINY